MPLPQESNIYVLNIPNYSNIYIMNIPNIRVLVCPENSQGYNLPPSSTLGGGGGSVIGNTV